MAPRLLVPAEMSLMDTSGASSSPLPGPALQARGEVRAQPKWMHAQCEVLSGTGGAFRKIISQFEFVNERNKLTKLIFQGILV